MSRIDSEERTIRVDLASYLATAGWSGLAYSQGWDTMDIENPLVNIYVLDVHKENLELGYHASTHKLFKRIVQIDTFMESESRVRSLCEDVMEYLDAANPTILDTMTTSGIGYLSFPDSETITSRFLNPSFNNPELLRWRGVVRGQFEAYYPNGGNPL